MARLTISLGLVTAALLCGCNRTDPQRIDVGVECPGGRPASATMAIHGELAAIRPVGRDKQIRISGARKTGESSCFADGGILEFTVTIEGQSSVDTPTPPLAHGAWQLTVEPLSGGEHPELPPIAHVLQPGVAHVVSVSATQSGELQAQLTP